MFGNGAFFAAIGNIDSSLLPVCVQWTFLLSANKRCELRFRPRSLRYYRFAVRRWEDTGGNHCDEHNQEKHAYFLQHG